jgi:hypothetical protein
LAQRETATAEKEGLSLGGHLEKENAKQDYRPERMNRKTIRF